MSRENKSNETLDILGVISGSLVIAVLVVSFFHWSSIKDVLTRNVLPIDRYQQNVTVIDRYTSPGRDGGYTIVFQIDPKQKVRVRSTQDQYESMKIGDEGNMVIKDFVGFQSLKEWIPADKIPDSEDAFIKL
ncbi:hypothetical protein ACFVS2_22090 [Brevibacillus sp. NPDC058079]|uniref:hypothetical protein n=1 Tax=Brevibacillus sp. NPDC058079 TaxID=3346330 RepID=UPI0036EFD270